MPQPFCPSAANLRSFVLGILPAAEFDRLIDHLDTCATCEETVSGLEATLSVVSPVLVRGARPVDAAEKQLTCAAPRQGSQGMIGKSGDVAGSTPPSPPELLRTGARLGNYQIKKLIGRGGMGQVYLATHTLLERDIALKVLPADAIGHQASIGRFQREMKLVAMLTHENIVSALDAGVANGWHYLSMPLLHGQDLGLIATWWAPLPIPHACEIIRQAALGLQHAHAAGIVHRDVKPSNLMLTRDETGTCRVKVLDLGLARSTQPAISGEFTSPGQIMGTLDYLAPEQAFAPEHIDHRTDIYGLGATLYRLIAGRIPLNTHCGQTIAQRLLALANSRPHAPDQLRPDLPESLARLMNSLLSISPQERPQSMAEIAERLQAFCEPAPDLRTLLDAPVGGQRSSQHFSGQHVQDAAGTSMAVEQSSSVVPAAVTKPRQRLLKWCAAAGLMIAAIGLLGLAAVSFFVQADGGTVEIRSELDGVVVRIVRNGDQASRNEWVIRRGTSTHQVLVGQLSLQLPAELNDAFLVEQDSSQLSRNGRIVATIRKRTPQPATTDPSAANGNSSTVRSAASASLSNVPVNIPSAAAPAVEAVSNEFRVHPSLTALLERQPIAVNEFEKNRLLERSKDWLREFRDGRLILDTLPAKRRLDAWPVIDFAGSGLTEIDVRLVNGSGWLVVFHNDILNRGFRLSLHEGCLEMGPSIFDGPLTESASSAAGAVATLTSRRLTEHASSNGCGNLDRLHVLIVERRVTVFLNGVLCGDPVTLGFDPGRHRVCLGVYNTNPKESTRVEFERIRKYALSSDSSAPEPLNGP